MDMAEGGGGKGPEIIIESKGASIGEIRKRAMANPVNPHQSLPHRRVEGPEGEEWAPWLVKNREEVDNIKNETLQVEIHSLARRPDVMVSKEVLQGSYDTIEGLVNRNEISETEGHHWQGKILMRYIEELEKEGKASTWEGLLNALPVSLGGAAVHAADEFVERFPGAVARWIKSRGWEKEARGTPPGGEGGPPEKPPEEPTKEDGRLPDNFKDLRKIIIDDETSEETRKKAMEKRDEMWKNFSERDQDHKAFVKDSTQTYLNILGDSTWDEVYDNVKNFGINAENLALSTTGFLKPEEEGMLRAAFAGEALRIRKIGFEKRFKKRPSMVAGSPEDILWLKMHGESEGEEGLKFLEKRVQREAFFQLGVEPHDFVKTSLSKKKFRPESEQGTKESADVLTAAAEAMRSAAESQSRMTMGEYQIDVKRYEGKVEELRAFVREKLDAIENSNRDTLDFGNTYIVRGLEVSLGAIEKIDKGIAREARARLAVHDCSELIKQADGWIFREEEKVGHGYAIGSAAAEAQRRGHQLNREIVETFLKRELLPGLDVPRAWDLLQQLNHFDVSEDKDGNTVFDNQEYMKWVDRVVPKDDKDLRNKEGKLKPRTNVNFFRETNPIIEEAVRNLLIEEIARSESVDGNTPEERRENAKKSLQLAEKLSRATLEDSVFNRGDTVGNDQVAEIFGLKKWREARRSKGRIRGPQVHEDEIRGFGTSWLRWTQEDKQTKKFKGRQRERLPFRVDTQMNVDNLDISQIEDNWQFYCSVIMTRYKLLSGLLLDRKPKIAEMDKTFMQEAVVYFNTADAPENLRIEKMGPMQLRGLWAVGVIDMALADKDLDIGRKSIGTVLAEFINTLTREELSPEVGTFLTEITMEDIKRRLNFNRRLAKLA